MSAVTHETADDLYQENQRLQSELDGLVEQAHELTQERNGAREDLAAAEERNTELLDEQRLLIDQRDENRREVTRLTSILGEIADTARSAT